MTKQEELQEVIKNIKLKPGWHISIFWDKESIRHGHVELVISFKGFYPIKTVSKKEISDQIPKEIISS